jgi:ribonuclease HI
MRRKKKGLNHFCAVKLDMMKAYDRVEWHFLEAMMLRLGFSDNTVRLILKCVSSVRFSVRVNGELLPFFTPSRGLRQGDPISPYLFLLCAEGFTALLNYFGGNYVDRGIRVSVHSPWINHLLFADDSLIFMSASIQSGERLNEILRIYGDCSGQSVNREKSSIFFSPNTPEHIRQNLKQLLGIPVEAFSERYLGLPTAVGRITSGSFDHIIDRIRGRIQGCEKLLSCAGREIFIKSVIQAISTYSMSCYKFTKKVCKSLSSCSANYWWSSSLDRSSLHWVSWEILASPKAKGGMGFRDLELFNLALLGKHGWRLMTSPDTLCAKVLKGRYYPMTDFLQATLPRNASATWRAIIAGREALQQGLIKRIGSGLTVDVWNDKWIPGIRSMQPTVHLGEAEDHDEISLVCDLIDNEIGCWKIDKVRRNFIPPEADAILNIPLRRGEGEDFWAWSLEKAGIYSVKSAYRALMSRNEYLTLDEGTITESSSTQKQIWSALWKLHVMPKVRVFWWRVLRGILPVESTLKHRHIVQIGRCKICLAADEDLFHALITCDHARRFWDEAQSWLDFSLPRLHPHTWSRDILCDLRFSDSDRAKIITVMWAIWNSRNNWTHDKGFFDPVQSMKMAKEALAVLVLPKKHTTTLPGYGWRPPDDDIVKINTDGGLSLEARKGGAGGVARSKSTYLGAWSKPLLGITDPLIAEALALREGVLFAHLRGFQKVVMETDCLEVVDLWNSRHGSRSTVTPILQDIGELALNFTLFVIQHVSRSANHSAHLCAKYACTLLGTSSWLDCIPDFLVVSIQAERSGVVLVE